MTEPAVGASTWAVGSQVCSGNIGTLMAKGEPEGREAQDLRQRPEDEARDGG